MSSRGYVDKNGVYRRIRITPNYIQKDGYFYSDTRYNDELEFQRYEEEKCQTKKIKQK
jgi:hypothetical protein